jgi:ParB family chromosome partitioning protein
VSKRALGRGIEALLTAGTETGAVEEAAAVVNVPVSRIVPSEGQPRKTFNEESLSELAASIRERGVLQPILVERRGEEYAIIAGERRFRASVQAGLAEVPVIVRSFTEQDRLQIALIENIQREDLTPIEEASAYHALMSSMKIGQEELARRLGKNRSTVANSLRLLNLPEEMQQAVSDGRMSPGHARAILSIRNPADQQLLFRRVVQEAISVREAEAAADSLNAGKKVRHPATTKKLQHRAAEIREVEQKLIDRLGTKVEVKGDLNRGKIEIAYYSESDLERLYDIILQTPS